MKIALFLFIPCLLACNNYHKAASEQQNPALHAQQDSGDNVKNERILIYNAYQLIRVKEIEGCSDAIEQMAKSTGGYVLEKSETLVRLRVPADSLEMMLLQTGQLGKVTDQNITGRDVTGEYIDLELRLDNARKARQRYLQLLEKAVDVSDILLIEKELERLQLSIETIQGQLNQLTEQIDFATITIVLEEKVKPGPLGWVFVGLYKGVKFLFVRG